MKEKQNMSVMQKLITQASQPHLSAKAGLQALVESQKAFQLSVAQPSRHAGMPAVARVLLSDSPQR
jgi:hypothetical protein